MSAGRIPWSWTAWVVSGLPAGGVLLSGMYVAELFRQGLDADMGPMLFAVPLHEYLFNAVLVGLIALPFVALGRWAANLTRRPAPAFYLLAAAVPVLLFAATFLWEAIDGHFLFPLFYLPNWIALAANGLSLAAAVWTYNTVLRAQASPGRA